jgi:hypothetical protein
MTNQEMLTKLGLSQEELADLLKKQSDFLKSLSPSQQAVVNSSSPSFAAAAASFGPDATENDLQRLVDDIKSTSPVITSNFAVHRPLASAS